MAKKLEPKKAATTPVKGTGSAKSSAAAEATKNTKKSATKAGESSKKAGKVSQAAVAKAPSPAAKGTHPKTSSFQVLIRHRGG